MSHELYERGDKEEITSDGVIGDKETANRLGSVWNVWAVGWLAAM